jgi:hypothetical protein
VTGTPGHEFGSMRRAVEESKNPNVEVIYMDKSLKHVTNGEVNSRMRPDVTVVTKDGRIATHEVMSKSQDVKQLKNKIEKMQDMLSPEKRAPKGVSGVFDVNGKELS